MGLRNKIVTGIGIVTLSALSLLGCGKGPGYPEQSTPVETQSAKEEQVEEVKDYFAQVNMYAESGMAISNGDFDGDLDFIIGARAYEGRLYFFENDGQGNFKLKPQSIIYPENYQAYE